MAHKYTTKEISGGGGKFVTEVEYDQLKNKFDELVIENKKLRRNQVEAINCARAGLVNVEAVLGEDLPPEPELEKGPFLKESSDEPVCGNEDNKDVKTI